MVPKHIYLEKNKLLYQTYHFQDNSVSNLSINVDWLHINININFNLVLMGCENWILLMIHCKNFISISKLIGNEWKRAQILLSEYQSFYFHFAFGLHFKVNCSVFRASACSLVEWSSNQVMWSRLYFLNRWSRKRTRKR